MQGKVKDQDDQNTQQVLQHKKWRGGTAQWSSVCFAYWSSQVQPAASLVKGSPGADVRKDLSLPQTLESHHQPEPTILRQLDPKVWQFHMLLEERASLPRRTRDVAYGSALMSFDPCRPSCVKLFPYPFQHDTVLRRLCSITSVLHHSLWKAPPKMGLWLVINDLKHAIKQSDGCFMSQLSLQGEQLTDSLNQTPKISQLYPKFALLGTFPKVTPLQRTHCQLLELAGQRGSSRPGTNQAESSCEPALQGTLRSDPVQSVDVEL